MADDGRMPNRHRQPARITAARQAGPDHRVLSVAGGGQRTTRRTPCSDCPWRKDAVGKFPPEAFILAAPTGYDVPETLARWAAGNAPSTFACHQSGAARPATCSGFLLSESAAHNLALRMSPGPIREPDAAGLDLFADYHAMAVANGVPADHPAIAPCRRAGT